MSNWPFLVEGAVVIALVLVAREAGVREHRIASALRLGHGFPPM